MWKGYLQVSLRTHAVCSLTQYREEEEASDKEPEIWPHWIAVLAHLMEHKPRDTNVPFFMGRLN